MKESMDKIEFGKTFAVLVFLGMTACGGGGGGSDATELPSFAGIWDARLDVAFNNCGVTGVDVLTPTLTVNQEDEHVVVDYPSGITFEGTATDSGFDSQGSKPGSCPGGVVTYRMAFADQGANQAGVTMEAKSSCPDEPVVCGLVWAGHATRR